MLPNSLLPDRSDRSDRSVRPLRSRSSFARDDRAIEGLPIRLVIALVVGVAALALMLNMLGTIGSVGDTEVDVEITKGQVVENGEEEDITIEVIDENGNYVDDATVLISSGSAQLEGTLDQNTADSSEEYEAKFEDVSEHGLRADQDKGTLEIDVVPPSDSSYIDEQPNSEIIVVQDRN
ncbi:DUF7382 domain-containing protein [Natronorubrum halophilum]|uniref:DUF7382 domain-containing protein n=1 Tax=Natronorubrum halophilum TaxID=1702106 RepID=UPI001EE877DC|nr:hypothetical protein [Natronorubrum halophilum]